MARSLRLAPDDARAILAYDRAVFDRFVRRVRNLSSREAHRARGIGHESLFATLVHILHVHEVWHAYIVRGRTSDRELGALFDDPRRKPKNWREFDAYAARVWAEIEATYARMSSRELGRTVKAFWMPGRYTVGDAVLQTTLEEAHHLGEVIGALWQDDRKPPDMTWIDVRRSVPRRRRST
ncbi:MAG TPA: DinB family protein [Thermoplasmata archaeon]|nr:DinB family protein [Thermoplasmata archaeon]